MAVCYHHCGCVCLSPEFPKTSFSIKNFLFMCPLYACVCVSRVTDDISLDPRLSAQRSLCISCLVFCNARAHKRRYKHAHTLLVSRYPVFPSPVTLSSWYCLSDSSWFVWVSVVTAQRPAPGDPDLSALSES